MEQSAELTEFYRAYNSWLESGALEESTFTRSTGLCCNLDLWCTEQNYSIKLYLELSEELEQQFKEANLRMNFPFNRRYATYSFEKNLKLDGEFSYNYEETHNIMHLNPRRIKWVKEHCSL